jgi:thiosulfate/3-mercaptopyruvate sulfurtransferase
MKREDMLIEADELLTQLDDPKLRIFDANIIFYRKEDESTAFELYQQGHLPSAAFFDHDDFSDGNSSYMYMVLPEAELAQQIGKIGIANDAKVVIYSTGMLACATRAWWLLRYAGLDDVRVLNGGLAAWEQAGGELEQGVNHYQASSFTPALRSEMFADKDQVLAAMGDVAVCTVHTLMPESYNKAHISGSTLLPFDKLLDNMTAFLPTEKLALELASEARHERVITYCGGGIAATVNAMAHLMAGNQKVAVYDGSMSEWQGEGLPLGSNETS